MGDDAGGVWVAFAAGRPSVYRRPAPGDCMRALWAKAVRAFAGSAVGGPAEVDPAGLARGLGDRGGAAFGGGVLGAVNPIQDRPDLGEQLGQVDGADPGSEASSWARGWRATRSAMAASSSVMVTRVAGGIPTGAVGAERSRASRTAGGLPPR
jgi:hypothetical protein